MKNYLILLKNSETGAESSIVLTGSFDLVVKMTKSVIRSFDPAVRKVTYIKSISEL
nr:MAG TPA: hypothetical protein [Microviridae sp.]